VYCAYTDHASKEIKECWEIHKKQFRSEKWWHKLKRESYKEARRLAATIAPTGETSYVVDARIRRMANIGYPGVLFVQFARELYSNIQMAVTRSDARSVAK
jgi:hypothetical protein